jgi:SPP1 gp7 family putative phage head morphogenesis protein
VSYDLREMARQGGVRRRQVRLRPITPSRGAEAEYRRLMLRALGEIADHVRREILPGVDRERRILTQDEEAGDRIGVLFGSLRRLLQRLFESAEDMTRRIFEAEAQRHTERFAVVVRSAVGIDMQAMLQATPGLKDQISLAVERNVELIRAIGEDMERRVAEAVTRNLSQGGSARDLSRDLTEQFGIEERRAARIARNEVANVNSQLNQFRQQEAGITEYVWRTSEDERVRDEHVALNGRTFRWDKPGPDDGNHPGEAIMCRCTAQAVIDLG